MKLPRIRVSTELKKLLGSLSEGFTTLYLESSSFEHPEKMPSMVIKEIRGRIPDFISLTYILKGRPFSEKSQYGAF